MARFNDTILAQDRARLRKNSSHLKILAAIIFCFQVISYGCASMAQPPNPLLVHSPGHLDPSQFDYLSERRDRIIPLVIQHLRESSDKRSLDALGCMASSPIDKVVLGGSESLEFREFLTQVLAEFKPELPMCLPLSGEWQVIAQNIEHIESSGSFWDALQRSGGKGTAPILWPSFCGGSLGTVCPVKKNYNIVLITDIVLTEGQTRELVGSGYSSEWTVTAWKYKALRDYVLAEAVSKALMALAIQYSGEVAAWLFENNEKN